MALLVHLGYHSISIQQYADWHSGKKINLPSRPILITFDDGRSDSWTGADQVLARYHMRATIFIITGRVSQHIWSFLSELAGATQDAVSQDDGIFNFMRIMVIRKF